MAEGTDYVGAVMGRMGTLCDDCLDRARQKAKHDHVTLQEQFQHARKRLRGSNGESFRQPLGALNENEVQTEEGESKRKLPSEAPKGSSVVEEAARVHPPDDNGGEGDTLLMREAQAITRDFTFKDLQRELKLRGIKAAGKKKELKDRLEMALTEELASEKQTERDVAQDKPEATTKTNGPTHASKENESPLVKAAAKPLDNVPVDENSKLCHVESKAISSEKNAYGLSPKKKAVPVVAPASVEKPPRPSPLKSTEPKTSKASTPAEEQQPKPPTKGGLLKWMLGSSSSAMAVPAIQAPSVEEVAAPQPAPAAKETVIIKNKVKDIVAKHEASTQQEAKPKPDMVDLPPQKKVESSRKAPVEPPPPPPPPHQQVEQVPVTGRFPPDRPGTSSARVERDRLEEVRARQERERELKRKQQLAKERAQQERLIAEKKRKEAEDALRKAAAVKRHEEAEARRKLREDEELRRVRALANGRPNATANTTPGVVQKETTVEVPGRPVDENEGFPAFPSKENDDGRDRPPVRSPTENTGSQSQSRLTPAIEDEEGNSKDATSNKNTHQGAGSPNIWGTKHPQFPQYPGPPPSRPAPPRPAPPRPPPPSESYEISDREDTTDDEDDDDDGDSRSNNRYVPTWACGSSLREALRRQADKDPSQVFNLSNSSCDLEEIFQTNKPFKSRSSSQNWSQDLSTYNERQKYRVEMGFTPPKSS